MLRITKRVKELTDQEVSLIPTIDVLFSPSNTGALMTLDIGDLTHEEEIPKHQILKLFAPTVTWMEIMAKGEFKRKLPLRIFIGKADNFKGRYYRYELILPGRGAISSMLPEPIRDYLKEREGANLKDYIHLVDGEWL